jgi:hypothetical protein
MKLRFPFKADWKALTSAGWSIVYGDGYFNGFSASKDSKRRHVRIENSTLNIKLWLNYDFSRAKKWYSPMFDGHTSFLLENSWRTFDRLGVGDSFYLNKGDNLNESIEKQVKRVLERRASVAAGGGYVKIPGLGFQITVSRKNEMINTLAIGKPVSLTPSGFGRGYFISPRHIRNYGAKTGSEELCKFFNAPHLYVLETEHD